MARRSECIQKMIFADIPWGECGAEYIIDATGAYCTTEKQHGTYPGWSKESDHLCTG